LLVGGGHCVRAVGGSVIVKGLLYVYRFLIIAYYIYWQYIFC
jgi:hypothetical protein